MNRKNFLSLTIATIIVVASAKPAMAYVLLSPRRRWATTPVTVRVNNIGNASITDGSRGVNATVSAIRVWSVVSSSSSSATAVRGQAPATIMLNTNGGLCSGGCLAATLTGYYTSQSGDDRINDADVYTNTARNFSSTGEACSGTEFDINGIMAHEVGHVIGIGHSNVSGSTMFPSVSACNTSVRSLAADDINAMNDLY